MIAKFFINARNEIIKDICIVFNCREHIILHASVQKSGGSLSVLDFPLMSFRSLYVLLESVDVIQKFVRSPGHSKSVVSFHFGAYYLQSRGPPTYLKCSLFFCFDVHSLTFNNLHLFSYQFIFVLLIKLENKNV